MVIMLTCFWSKNNLKLNESYIVENKYQKRKNICSSIVEWEEQFTVLNAKCECYICHTSVQLPKRKANCANRN